MPTTPPEDSAPGLVSRRPHSPLKILAAIGLLGVTIILASNLGVFNQNMILRWKERVLLPSGKQITVKRTEEYIDKRYWIRESIEIPNPDPNEPPIIWHSDTAGIKGVPRSAHALALYFENSIPKLIAYDHLDADYGGCGFTDGIRLFTWTKVAGWRYDPYTKIHTRYVGPANLYSWNDYRLPALIPFLDTPIGPIASDVGAFRQNIDTLHANTRCNYPPQISLADILNGPKE